MKKGIKVLSGANKKVGKGWRGMLKRAKATSKVATAKKFSKRGKVTSFIKVKGS